MREIQAVVTDLDGTIVDADHLLSPATLEAVSDLVTRGIPLILATARTPSWVARLAELTASVRVAVCCGGAIGWVPQSGEMLWRDTIPAESVRRIVDAVTEAVPDPAIAVYDAWTWWVTPGYAERGPKRRGTIEVVPVSQIAGYPACSLSLCDTGTDATALTELLAGVEPGLALETSASSVTDIAAHGTDKAHGVTLALAAAGIDPAHAICFGDMPMDIPMFDVCGYSVAVGNAHPDLMARATEVSACIHDDGFARTLGALGLARPYPSDVVSRNCCGNSRRLQPQ